MLFTPLVVHLSLFLLTALFRCAPFSSAPIWLVGTTACALPWDSIVYYILITAMFVLLPVACGH